ncbi:hypothetical protein AgCh_027900 [Apium graveolens]
MIQFLPQPTTTAQSTLHSLNSENTSLSSTSVSSVSSLHSHLDITKILESYSSIFDEPKTLPPKRPFDHHITLELNAKPVNVRPNRFTHFQKTEIEKQVQHMLELGLVRPSISPYSSPILLVRKKDGTWHLCTDYRALNAITLKDRFPIPTVDELLDELGGAVYFSKIDLRAGFHQIRMVEEDISKTAFRTHCGHFEYLVLPFGLSNAPSTFQATMHTIFRPFSRQFVTIFFDDILIYSKDWESHKQHLIMVFDCLQNNSLFAKLSKCKFAATTMEYLGNVITPEGVHPDHSKIEAVTSWHAPTNLKQLRGFLGLSGYYRKFVKGYASIASPLTDLLKRDAFEWNEERKSELCIESA